MVSGLRGGPLVAVRQRASSRAVGRAVVAWFESQVCTALAAAAGFCRVRPPPSTTERSLCFRQTLCVAAFEVHRVIACAYSTAYGLTTAQERDNSSRPNTGVHTNPPVRWQLNRISIAIVGCVAPVENTTEYVAVGSRSRESQPPPSNARRKLRSNVSPRRWPFADLSPSYP